MLELILKHIEVNVNSFSVQFYRKVQLGVTVLEKLQHRPHISHAASNTSVTASGDKSDCDLHSVVNVQKLPEASLQKLNLYGHL